MTVFNKCEKCNEWTIERTMDYFSGIGLVCPTCSRKLLKENEVKDK